MTLVLEIEYLNGVSYSSTGPGSSRSEWPPQPDRIFSALVATWAYHGQLDRERKALEWLESLPVPTLYASAAAPRKAAVTYVPPNDPSSIKSRPRKPVSIVTRWRQPRLFPAVRPDDPFVRVVWPTVQCDPATVSALDSLARDTAYIGHSASLTRCRFVLTDESGPPPRGTPPQRRIYPGRLADLQRAFEGGLRPGPGDPFRAGGDVKSDLSGTAFGSDWLILELADGQALDIRAHAMVAHRLRSLLIEGYHRAGLGDRVPEAVAGPAAGHPGNGSSHLAIVPLAFVGFPHADGHLLGIALVPPAHGRLLHDPGFRAALRAVSQRQPDGRRMVRQSFRVGSVTRELAWVLTLEPSLSSTDPTRFLRPSTTFATVTPLVLDRHLKTRGEARRREITAQIAQACEYSGLPSPSALRVPESMRPPVEAGPYPFVEGVPPSWTGQKSPPWTRWQLPAHLQTRPLCHAVIHFDEPVQGPVILGAGRFLGLGLCVPVADGTRGRALG